MDFPDAHTHLGGDLPQQAPAFLCAASPDDWASLAAVAADHPTVTPFFGIHPWYLSSSSLTDLSERLPELLDQYPHAGIGEIGLDKCRRGILDLSRQKEVLRLQLDLARQKKRPVALHCCRAWGSLAAELRHYPELSILLHGWSGALDPRSFPQQKILFSLGPNLLSPTVPFPTVPQEKLVIESDGKPDILKPLYRYLANKLSVSDEQLRCDTARRMDAFLT